MSFGELSIGEMSVGEMSSGNCPSKVLRRNVHQGTVPELFYTSIELLSITIDYW